MCRSREGTGDAELRRAGRRVPRGSRATPRPVSTEPIAQPPSLPNEKRRPETGRRSVARLGRRAAALAIDWALATLLSLAFFSPGDWQTDPFATLGIFAVLQVVFQILFGGGLGHLMLGMRVVPITFHTGCPSVAQWRRLSTSLATYHR